MRALLAKQNYSWGSLDITPVLNHKCCTYNSATEQRCSPRRRATYKDTGNDTRGHKIYCLQKSCARRGQRRTQPHAHRTRNPTHAHLGSESLSRRLIRSRVCVLTAHLRAEPPSESARVLLTIHGWVGARLRRCWPPRRRPPSVRRAPPPTYRPPPQPPPRRGPPSPGRPG